MSRTIDAHHHLWRAGVQKHPWRNESHGTLEADFGPEDLEPELRSANIDATVLMQSADEPAENDRLVEYAKSDFVAGVVAWLPLSDREAALRELRRMHPHKVCGVRALIGRDSLDWLTRGESLALFQEIAQRNLAWDVVPVTTDQIAAILKLAAAVPELRIVVDHLGRPPIDVGGWQPWADHLKALAACPSVAVKVSVGIDVLTTWDSWKREDLIPYVRWVGEHFGASRLMLGSNWPVILLKSDYQRAWQDLLSAVRETFPGEAEQALLRGGTAEKWYGLSVPTAARGVEHLPAS